MSTPRVMCWVLLVASLSQSRPRLSAVQEAIRRARALRVYDFMRFVLSTDHGRALYKQRAQLIEPIFGNTKHNRGFTRFARRGRSAARTEWRLMASTHNLLKLHRHFTAPA